MIGVLHLAMTNQLEESWWCALDHGGRLEPAPGHVSPRAALPLPLTFSTTPASDARYARAMADHFSEPILHVDMDAFFVEVERLTDPTLRGVPVIVGGLGNRGVVAACSYEARAYGVRSAMPIVEARRRCPRARYIAPTHGRYGEVSGQVFEVLRSFTPAVEGLSVDEAFLDISGLWRHYDSAVAVAEAIRATIRAEVGIPSSVGVAANKFLAKLASEEAKPNGLWVVKRGEELEFLHPLPVRRLWGVGEATYAALDALRIETVGDVAAAPLRVLEDRLGPSLARHLVALANAEDDRAVEPGGETKSISVEVTYETDLDAADAIERALLRHCDRLSARLRRAELAGRTITLKVRFGDFTTITRSHTGEVPIEHTPDLWDVVRDLLGRVDLGGRGVRLLGLGAGGLVASADPRQMSLAHPARDAVAEAAEQVRARFGDDAVVPARLVDPPESDQTRS